MSIDNLHFVSLIVRDASTIQKSIEIIFSGCPQVHVLFDLTKFGDILMQAEAKQVELLRKDQEPIRMFLQICRFFDVGQWVTVQQT